jgi:predicted acyl esterase
MITLNSTKFHMHCLVSLSCTGMLMALVLGGCSAEKSNEKRGTFFDYPVEGLHYTAQPSGLSGTTDQEGGYGYRDGDRLTFVLGDTPLGTIPADTWITPLDLVPDAQGDVHVPRLNNIGMLIQSLDRNGNIEDGIHISNVAHDVVRNHVAELDLDQPSEQFFQLLNDAIVPDISQQGGFDPVTGGVMKNTDETGAHYARTPEMARNQLRRTGAGIMRITDIKIPLRDYDPVSDPTAYLLGTLHRPIGPDVPNKVPVVINVGVYGKDKIFGSICRRNQLQAQAIVEDRYHTGNPDQLPYENHESVNTFQWVPEGYAVLRVDEAGIGRSPGTYLPRSRTGAKNFIDTIEWAGKQPWSNGNVGTIGISYYAMNQWHMAPLLADNTSLKAMIPWEGAVDPYRDYMYPGGLFLDGFTRMWSFMTSRNHCGDARPGNIRQKFVDTPFNDPTVWEEHTPDLDNIRIPFLSAAGIDNMTIHPRGNDMAFRFAKSKNKLLRIQSGSHIGPFYSADGVADQMAFFDYWLKGIENGIMSKPPVKIAIKTGDARGVYWSYADAWPLPQTRYTKFYLDARPEENGFRVDGTMPVYRLVPSGDVVTAKSNPKSFAPREEASATYSAFVKPIVQLRGPPPPKFDRPQACDSYGVSFTTPPLEETITLAGHAKLVTWVSSSTDDMDIHASLRVYDETGEQVVYSTDQHRLDAPQKPPIQVGRLKVSQRALDVEKSTFFQPVHTHLERDSSKLQPGAIVEVEIEFWPMTAEINKGHRIVVDVQPYHGCGHVWPHEYAAYNTGTNTIHTGPEYVSYMQLPIVSELKADTGIEWALATP